MSDWKFLNSKRVKTGPMASTPEDGFNGAFIFALGGRPLFVIASDGLGWQHVSVSQQQSSKPPTWETMCAAKDLFWEPEDCCVQYHPPKSCYVNNSPGCLHIWKPMNDTLPQPPAIMVGLKELNLS